MERKYKSRHAGWACLLTAVVSMPPLRAAPQGMELPTPMRLGETVRFELDLMQRKVCRITLPAGCYQVVLDTRLDRLFAATILSRLSILDEDGAALQTDAIRLYVVDTEYRAVHPLSLEAPRTLGLQVTHDTDAFRRKRGIYWLTVVMGARRETAVTPEPPRSGPAFGTDNAMTFDFVPLFGETIPSPMAVDEPRSGVLRHFGHAYHLIRLKPGAYRATLEFAVRGPNKFDRSESVPVWALKGNLSLLNGDGSFREHLVRVDCNDCSLKTAAASEFTIHRDGDYIVRVHRTGGTSDPARASYRISFSPSEGKGDRMREDKRPYLDGRRMSQGSWPNTRICPSRTGLRLDGAAASTEQRKWNPRCHHRARFSMWSPISMTCCR